MLSCEFFCFDEAIKRPLPVKARKIFVCQIQRFYGWIPPIKNAEVPEEKSSQDFPKDCVVAAESALAPILPTVQLLMAPITAIGEF